MQDIESPEDYQEKMHQILKEAAALRQCREQEAL